MCLRSKDSQILNIPYYLVSPVVWSLHNYCCQMAFSIEIFQVRGAWPSSWGAGLWFTRMRVRAPHNRFSSAASSKKGTAIYLFHSTKDMCNYWAIPEIRCIPPKEDMGIPKIYTTFFIGKSPKIKLFFGCKGKEDMGIPKIFNIFSTKNGNSQFLLFLT